MTTHQPLDAFHTWRQDTAERLHALADAVAGGPGPLGPAAERLHALADRTAAGRFTVLLLGAFSSGKSTLVNALLGRPLLPTKVNPCTAILTEVRHGREARVTVQPREGEPSAPLTPEDFLARYQLSAADVQDAGAEATDRFGALDRAVLEHPAELLRHGVVLVDTPGLDDDPARTARTLAALPHADAVIVVLNAVRFLTGLERRTLARQLAPLGLTNLFFPVTMVDLLDALADDPPAALADLSRRAREELTGLTTVQGEDRFDARVFLLDARGAVDAVWDRAADAPRATPGPRGAGFEAFERSLERFLVEERGRARAQQLTGAVRSIADDLARRHALDEATARADVHQLEARIEALQPRLDALDALAEQVAATVQGFVARQQALVFHDLTDFLADTELALPDALAEADLGAVPSLELLTPGGRQRVHGRLQEHLTGWLDRRAQDWQRTLEQRLRTGLAGLADELRAEADDFDALVSEITERFAGARLDLSRVAALGPDASPEEGPRPDTLERWLGVAMGAVLLSPGTAAAGWTEGLEGAARGAAGRVGVRMAVLGLGALLGPIGWAGVLLYAATDAAVMVLTGDRQVDRLRHALAEQVRGQLTGQAEALRPRVHEHVAEALEPIRRSVVDTARDEAVTLRTQLEATVAARREAAADAATRATHWAELLDQARATLQALQQEVP